MVVGTTEKCFFGIASRGGTARVPAAPRRQTWKRLEIFDILNARGALCAHRRAQNDLKKETLES